MCLKQIARNILLAGLMLLFSPVISAQTMTLPNGAKMTPDQVKSKYSSLSDAEKKQLNETLNTDGESTSGLVQDQTQTQTQASDSTLPSDQKIREDRKVQAVPSPIESIFIYSFDPDNNIELNTGAVEVNRAQLEYTRQYGYDIFSSNNRASFSPSSLPINDEYIVGPGDTLVVHVWGKVEERSELTIDRDGKIVFPQVGEIYLAGVKFKDLKPILKRELSRHFVNFDLNVSLGRLRSVRIFILGDAVTPGAYDVPAMSTVFNSLYRAGGSSKMGSLRQIKLIRNGRTISTVDLYDYLLSGDRRQDPMVENNDTIFVSPIGDTVKVSGMVKRPAIYEVTDGTTLWEAINLAGGFTAVAFFKRVQLVRIVEGEYRVIEDVHSKTLEESKRLLKAIKVKDGDYVSVLPIAQSLRNYVTLKGNVARAGDYEIFKGMTLGKLIESAQGLLPGTHMRRIDILRHSAEQTRELITIDLESPNALNFPLKEWDIVRIYSNQELDFKKTVSISGAVEKPGEYPLFQNMKVSDLIFLGRLSMYAITNDVELHRRQEDGKTLSFRLNVVDFLKDPSLPGNVLLQPDDELYVKRPVEEVKRNRVTIGGQIRFPGSYVIKDGETLRELIERSGGFTDKAFLKGLVFAREIPSQEISNQYRILKNEEKRMIYDQGLLAELPREDMILATSIMESRTAALTLLRTQLGMFQNRVIVDVYSGTATGYEVSLQNGDSITIPIRPSTVQMIGGVQNPSLIFHQSNKPLSYYLEKVGGYSDFAHRKGIVIFKADGSVSKDYSLVEPGDVVYVPEKLTIPFSAWRFTRGVLTGLKLIAESFASIILLQAVVNGL